MEGVGRQPMEGIYSQENSWDILGKKRKGPGTDL